MTATLSSTPYLFLFIILFEPSNSFAAENVESYLHPSMDDPISLIRLRRAASDPLLSYVADIEISFPDASLDAEIKSFLQNTSLYQSLLSDSTTVTSIDFSPACNLNGSIATCSCGTDFDCVGTLGPCNDTGCICITTLPLQRYCIPKLSIAMSPQRLFNGDTLTITCNFTELASISWYHNSAEISNDSKYNTAYSQQGARYIYTLKITNLSDSDKGDYTCAITFNATRQDRSITTGDIIQLGIDQPSNIGTFCNGSSFNLTCCSKDIDAFIVTWAADRTTGIPSSNATCAIYTVTPNVTECNTFQLITYTCKFQKNEGATASKTIEVTYMPKAKMTASPYQIISAGKSLDITCHNSFKADRINIAKDTTSNILSSTPNIFETIFQIKSTTVGWSGTFICTVHKNSLESSINITVNVVALPRREAIHVYPIQSYVRSGTNQTLTCCVVDANYNIHFKNGDITTPGKGPIKFGDQTCYTYEQSVNSAAGKSTVNCVVSNSLVETATSTDMTIILFAVANTTEVCLATDDLPETPYNATFSQPCYLTNPLQLGNINYTCSNGKWVPGNNDCYSEKIFNQLQSVKDLINGPAIQNNLEIFLSNLTTLVKEEKDNITSSSKNIDFMVEIISIAANANVTVNAPMMQDYIETVDIVINQPVALVNKPNQSSTILESVENFAKNLKFSDSIKITNTTGKIQLIGKILTTNSTYNGSFSFQDYNGSVAIKYGSMPGNSSTVVTIAYATMKDILPPGKGKEINGLVMSTVFGNLSSKDIKNDFNITMSFTKNSSSQKIPECAWFDLGQKAWNKSGCKTTNDDNLVTCTCDHLTSFSVLMGDIQEQFLDIITYAGVGVSLVCLVITLVIEAIVWRSVIKNKTSYLRHVCLVNIAVTLLVADVWFIIGAALEKYPSSNACQTAAFFSFLFYLSLFFWMLTNGLVLFYRLIYIFHDMSRGRMMMIAFILGYGCPLLICTITVASTAPGRFTSGEFCWLAYIGSMSFLAFVVPALTIVFVNVIILVVVIIKLLRPAIGERPGQEERQVIVVITKTIAVLTPLLGTTWGFGLGVVAHPTSKVLHGIFAALNSFQGLFILISTVWLDQKVRMAVRSSISSYYMNTRRTKEQTTSTLSSPHSKPIRKKALFAKKDAYNLFNAQSLSTGASSDSYSVLT